MDRILSIDFAIRNVGVAVIHDDLTSQGYDKLKIADASVITTKAKNSIPSEIKNLRDIFRQLKDIISSYNINYCVAEIMHGAQDSKSARTKGQTEGIYGSLNYVCGNVKFHVIMPKDVHTHFGATGKNAKLKVYNRILGMHPDLQKRFGNNKGNVPDHITDAIGIYYAWKYKTLLKELTL